MYSNLFKSAVITATWFTAIISGGPAARAADTLDLSYDPATGSLISVPPPYYMQLNSPRGLFTQIPAIRVGNFYEHYFEVFQPQTPTDSLQIGPVLTPGVTLDELLLDLCVEAQTSRSEFGVIDYFETIRLNGQVLHAEPADCIPMPPEFPPMTGERTALLQYDAITGDLRMRSQSPLATMEIQSKSGSFTGTPRNGVFIGVFDVARADKLFKLMTSGFVELDMGPVVAPELASHTLLADICANGAWLGGGHATLDYAYPGAGAVPIPDCVDQSPRTEAAISLEYNADDGQLTIETADLLAEPVPPGAAAADEVLLMTTLELRSVSGAFTGPVPPSLSGAYDQQTPFRILKQDREGFASVDLGMVLAPGLSAEQVATDVTLDVTFLGGHALKQIHVVPVPEPTGCAWLLCALPPLIRYATKK
jgi:hypothetical protein